MDISNNQKIGFLSPKNTPKFNDKTDIEVWEQTKSSDKNIQNSAFQELFQRHDHMLAEITRNISSYYTQYTTYEDVYQNARMGAMIAYKRYNPDKVGTNKAKLSTFVYKTVQCHLLDQIDHESFINCPSQKRAHRSYFAGKYNNKPIKKEKFEIKNKLTTQEDIDKAKEKYALLQSKFISYDSPITEGEDSENSNSFLDLLKDNRSETEDILINKIEVNRTIQQMPLSHQIICKLFFLDQYKIPDIEKELSIPKSEIKKTIREIKSHFKNNFTLI
jgi:RNA polymerase sigma factor (sigma-70 family)